MGIENKKIKPFLLVELLESFSENELEGLGRFIDCKYFNTDKYVVKLLNVLRKKVIGKRRLSAENQYIVYGEVFADLTLGAQTLTKAQKATFNAKMNALTRLAERFIIIEALEKDEVHRSDLLCRELLERKQIKLFSRHLKRGEKQIPSEAKNGGMYLYLYKMETNRLNYLNRIGRLKLDDNLAILNESLDIYYLINKLNLRETSLSLINTYQKSYYLPSEEDIEILLDLPQYAELPILQIHRKMVDLLQEQTSETFSQLVSFLDRRNLSLPKSDVRAAFAVAGNFCLLQIRKGHTEYSHYLFELYKTMDAKNLILVGSAIPIETICNMITLSSRIGEFKWAEEMIYKYTPFIIKKIGRDDVRDYNLGVIAFYRKDYETAIDYLYKIGNININYDLIRRTMIVKSYYETETEYKETTAQMFRSIEKYVKEHKTLHATRKKAYKTFIRILINLYRVRHREGKMTLESIKKKLDNAEFISDKKWLVEKIEELEKAVSRRC